MVKRFFNLIAPISILLASSILLSSCSAEKTSEDATDSSTTDTMAVDSTDSRIYPDLPEKNFDGYEFNYLHWYVTSWSSRMNKDLYAESENADTINDAVYNRNLSITEKYNVTFAITNDDNAVETFKKMVQTDDSSYDAIYIRVNDASSLLSEGYYLDLNKLEYLDFTKPWWDKASIESLSIQNKVYLAATDLNIIDKDATAAIAFNKAYAADYKLEDMYQLVKDGKWTIDKMESLYKKVSNDLNSDGKMNEEDLYGFLGGHDVASTFFQGAGCRYISKDEDDIPYLCFDTEYNFNVAQRLYDLMKDSNNFYNHHQMKAVDDTEYEHLFTNGHGLFFWMRLDNVTAMRTSDIEFGILPIPKYEEAQEKYYSTVSVHTCGLFGVPTTAANSAETMERTGIVIEALSAESKYTLQPAYYEVALKGKSLRDNESEEMLDIIFANRIYDIAEYYTVSVLPTTILYLANSNSFDVASRYEKNLSKIQKALDKFISEITV